VNILNEVVLTLLSFGIEVFRYEDVMTQNGFITLGRVLMILVCLSLIVACIMVMIGSLAGCIQRHCKKKVSREEEYEEKKEVNEAVKIAHFNQEDPSSVANQT
jgi:Na+/proline symporter